MPKSQTTAAQKARAAQQAEGGKYTTLLRRQESVEDPSWCPTCRYSSVLHTGGRCPEPAVYKVGEANFDGPHWGGGLHTHGTDYWVLARADGGRGGWLHPNMAFGGPNVLKGALHIVQGGLNVPHLAATLTAGFPGIRHLDWWPGLNEPDLKEEPVTLTEGAWTWDCENYDCGWDD